MFGIDVQQLSFPFMRKAMRSIVRRALDKVGVSAVWDGANREQKRSGALRNELNSRTIAHFTDEARKKQKPTKVLYFAHNEHVAKSCTTSRITEWYGTEGMYLGEMDPHVRYLAIATFSPVLWNTHAPGPPRKKKTVLPADISSRLKEDCVLLVAGKTMTRKKSIDMNYYTTDDFDFTIMQHASPPLR